MRDPLLEHWKGRIRRQAEGQAQKLSDDVLEELAGHFADLYAAARGRGEKEDEARRSTLAVLERGAFQEIVARPRARQGSTSRLDARDRPSSPAVRRVWNDVIFDARHALRGMRRNPAFTAVVVAILAVGIGATTAGFTVIDAVLLRALPYPDPDALVALKHVAKSGVGSSFSPADWRDYASRNAGQLSLAASASWPMNLTGDGEPARLRSVIVSGNFFEVAGQKPLRGRVTGEADDRPSAPGVVVLSHNSWTVRFARDPAVVGRDVLLNGRPATIVGVMPADFALPTPDVDLWMPMGLATDVLSDRAGEWLSVLGRLRPGTRLRTAQASLAATASSLAEEFPQTNAGESVILVPLLEEIVGGVRDALVLGALAVLAVLLASCANVASLLLARATFRQDEIVLRAALGADAWRLARQLLVESAVLAGAGGAIGLGAAWAFLTAFVSLGEGRVPRLEHAHLNGFALAITVGASIATALLFGGGAAWVLGRTGIGRAGRLAGPRATASPRAGGALLAGQVAFALVLVTGALRVAAGYAATNRIDPGFDVSDTLTMQLTLPRSRFADSTAHVRFVEGVLEEVSALPGVTAVGVVSDLPFVGNQMHFAARVEAAGPPRELQLGVRLADAGYFHTLQVPLIAGRCFEASDVKGSSPVALVNRTAAEMLWGGQAVNQHLLVSDDGRRQIVGVVGDIRHAGLHASEGPVVYIPYAQKPFDFVNWIGLVVRGPGIERSSSVVKAAIAHVDPNQPAYGVMTMEDYLTRERAPFRLGSLVVGCLAGAAFILAMSGIYGLTAFIVGNRVREFGVRLALGATRAGIVALVLRQVTGMLVLGSLAGVLGVLATGGWLQRTVLSAVSSVSTPSLLGGALALFGASSLAAALAPALRASRTDPRSALQAE